jgi:hypothetical protein
LGARRRWLSGDMALLNVEQGEQCVEVRRV